VHLAVGQVVEVGRRALDAGLDGGRGAPGARPGPEEARGRDLAEDSLCGLVLHEAHVGLAVGGREGHDVQVDYVGGRLVDVRLWRGEGLEVGRVGVADLDDAGVSLMAGVGAGVLFSPARMSCVPAAGPVLGCNLQTWMPNAQDTVLRWSFSTFSRSHPATEALTLLRIPQSLRRPNHTGRGVFDRHESLVVPVDEIRTLPHKDPKRPFPLSRVPSSLLTD